jgi:hypothetical protein
MIGTTASSFIVRLPLPERVAAAMAGNKAPQNGVMDASAARIRDNQRRSRARRKEYLEDMQKKLHEYERQGVQATLDMQQAARDVALENDALRLMLQRRGVSVDDITAFVHAFAAANGASTPQSSHDLDLGQKTLGLKAVAPEEHAPANSYCTPAIRTPPEYGPTQYMSPAYTDVVLPPVQAVETDDSSGVDKLAVLAHASARQGCCSSKTTCTVPPEPSQAPSPAATVMSFSQHQSTSPESMAQHSPLEMSCSQAARIIADMQGHGDYGLTKSALGCGASQECMVKNAVVFHMLDNQQAM